MAADKAIESGKNITIQLEMNGYDRRIVHVEVADISGVVSESVVKDGVKYVQIQPVSE
jgi:predicted RNA-binding protein Jag